MSTRKLIFWSTYFLIFSFSMGEKAYDFFMPQSTTHTYFHILYTFDVAYFHAYFACFLQNILNIIHCGVLLLYIFRIRLFNPSFWQHLLILRFIFEITGHSYEMNSLISIYHLNPKASLLIILSTIIFYTPSYVACYRYAFNVRGSHE